MLEELITTFEVHEYLLLQGCEELERFWRQMCTLYTSHDVVVVATASSTLHP
jgi:hypothetical protein